MTVFRVPETPLPPGELVQLLEVERADRQYLLRAADAYGPIFKSLSGAHLTICIVGLARGRRFLRDHGDSLKPVAPELESLFPEGFMRQMQGDTHRRYRGALGRAVDRGAVENNREVFEGLMAAALDRYARIQHTDERPSRALVGALSGLALDSLLHLFFGCLPGSALNRTLSEDFCELGPYGLVWTVGPRQQSAFAKLRADIVDVGLPEEDCVLQSVLNDRALDETMLGNLIYMVEIGRYDIQAYLRWVVWHGAGNPEILDRIAADETTPSPWATAFALEALRMDESERLLRKVEHDIEFDGYLIPETATVRICLWESHKLEDSFVDPFLFDPSRFVGEQPSSDEYSPFGLDHHQCPFSHTSVQLGAVFIDVLARRYRVAVTTDGEAIRGPYHWEPATRFTVELTRR